MPIPTYYGDEISYVNGVRYAKDVALDVVRYRASKLGFLSEDPHGGSAVNVTEETSHEVIVRWLAARDRSRVLTLDRSGGLLAARLEALGHRVTAPQVDFESALAPEPPGSRRST